VPSNIEIAPQGDILRARISGVIDEDLLPHFPGWSREIVATARANGCSGIFFDTRGADLRIGRSGIYEAAHALARALVSGIRVAAVVDPHHLTPDRIFQKLLGLAGKVARVFVDEQEALEWLDRTRERPGGGAERMGAAS